MQYKHSAHLPLLINIKNMVSQQPMLQLHSNVAHMNFCYGNLQNLKAILQEQRKPMFNINYDLVTELVLKFHFLLFHMQFIQLERHTDSIKLCNCNF